GGSAISNTATISYAAAEDSNAANDTSTDTTPVISDDLVITKDDGQMTAVPGTTITYTVVVSNASTSTQAANGATVSDTFPASLSNLNLTVITAMNGATFGATTGEFSGPFSDSVNLPVNSSITYTFTGLLAADATGSLANTATVTAPAGFTEGNTANNSATDTDTLTPVLDVSVTKNDGVTEAVPGQTTTYTITVSNTGPSTATATSLTDMFAASISAATWTSV